MSEQHPADALQDELVRLRAAMARRMREKLEAAGEVSPAWMEAARKFLSDQLTPERAPKAPPVVRNLPFRPDEA